MNESWVQIITVIITNFTVVWWFRKESREDWIRSQNTIDAIKEEMKDFHKKMYDLDRDFNERLLKIEMDRKK